TIVIVPLLVRAAWIHGKVAALSSPSPPLHQDANTKLPPKLARPRVVLIGDSRIARWPTAALANEWDVVNSGVAGETAAQLAFRFASDALALDPDVIVIEAGINDLVAASFLDEASKRKVIQDTAKTLIRLATNAASSGSQVYLGTIIPPAHPDIWRLAVWDDALPQFVAEVNATLRHSRLPDNVHLIDLAAILDTNNGKELPDQYRFDALHVNDLGYNRITNALQSLLVSQHSRQMQSIPD